MKAAVRQLLFGSSAWTPAGLFRSGAQGAWYDSAQLGSMYQDSAGTTPVTAVGQPVGLRLDMRNGLARGAELSLGAWSSQGGAVITGTNAAPVITTSSGSGGAVQLFTTVAEAWYVLACDWTGNVTASARIYSDNLVTQLATTGDKASNSGDALIFKATTTTTRLYLRNSGIGAVSASNVRLQPLTGNHATQSTSTSRPTLQQDAGGRCYGSLDGVDDSVASATGGGGTAGFFFCGAIYVGGGAGTIRTLWMDRNGTAGGYQVRINASNQLEFIAGNGTVVSGISTVGTLPVGETHVVTAWDDGVNFKGQIDSGAVTSATRPAVLAGTAGFTIGKNNTAATEFFPGRDYGMVYRKDSAPTATEIARTQRYLAARAGITL